MESLFQETRVDTSKTASPLCEPPYGTSSLPPVSVSPVQTLCIPCPHSLSPKPVHADKKMDTLSAQAAQEQEVDTGHEQGRDRANGQGVEVDKTCPTLILSSRPIRTTEQQEKVLTFFREAEHCVTQLRRISGILHIPYGTVRHIIRRLASLGLLTVIPYHQPGIQGIEVRYVKEADTFLKKRLSPVLCPSPSQKDTLSGQDEWTPSGQPLHRKKDREKNLSIWDLSLDDLDTLWPAAKAAGLFPGHLRKIREAFEQQGWLREKSEAVVAQTLRYLDWQLEHGGIIDQHGKKVEDPVAYWFRSMQRHGYYQQPKGYADPQLQALRQLEEEEKAVVEAKKNVLALRAEQEKLAQEEEIEKTLQDLARQGKEHPLWKQVYTLLPGMLRQKVDAEGSAALSSPMAAGVIRADLRRLYGFQSPTKTPCPKVDTPAVSPSTVY